MKKSMRVIVILFGCLQALYGQNAAPKKTTHGILFMAGGRYDNLRMCVGSSAGVKGGPVADIMLITKKPLNGDRSMTFNLPLMRPILFGLAFKMLQFEPEVTLEHHKRAFKDGDLIMGPGLGISFHYGPDYRSSPGDRGESFFAMGPFLSWQTGIALKKEGSIKSVAGIKAFYVPLFARERSSGTVLGGALLYTLYL